MNYIVNPWLFYLIGVCDSIKLISCIALCVSLLVLGISSFLICCEVMDCDSIVNAKRIVKVSSICLAASAMAIIFVPGKSDAEKMLMASVATEENVNTATNYGKDIVDYIFDKVNGEDED